MSDYHLTRDELKEGANVRVLGALSPARRKDAPKGKIKSWRESRFGGVFVEVERRTTHAEICGGGDCEQCRDHTMRDKEITALLTYAMSDLVLV